jgi:uncharacterized surface protein with fasciclin (FAS1) repeats
MFNVNRATALGAAVFALSLSSGLVANSFAKEMSVEVGGAAMYPSKNIIQNAVNSKDHTTLVAAVKAAGLVKTLEGKGPFTVFAPTNEAFQKLPDGTVANLLKPANKTALKNVLTYHVVAGDYSAAKLAKEAKANGGKLDLKTVEGEHITIEGDNMGGWWVVDGKGDKAKITIADVDQSNGVIHVIDGVLLPN